MNVYSPKDLTELLEKHGFFFKKNLGQNFLISENVARRIAETAFDSMPDAARTVVLEIGPGAGALTRQLSSLFDHVIALEIDPHLIPVLEEILSDCRNTEVILCDALKYPFDKLLEKFPGHSFAVCSNLPYYLTSPLIMKFLESRVPFESVTVLIQKEAADRLCAPAGSDAYGAIGAVASFYAEAKRCFTVSAGNFIPRPKVESAVLRFTPHKTRPVEPKNTALFFRVIHAAFAQRRKTILNALSSDFASEYAKETIKAALDNAGIDQARRGETLDLPEFARISDFLVK